MNLTGTPMKLSTRYTTADIVLEMCSLRRRPPYAVHSTDVRKSFMYFHGGIVYSYRPSVRLSVRPVSEMPYVVH